MTPFPILPTERAARVAIAFLCCVSLFACPRARPPAPESTSLPAITIAAKDKLLYTFFDPAGGAFASTTDATEIPEAQRGWVRVLRLKAKADQRPEHELVYVVDLDKAGDDGTLPYIVVSRRAFEIAAQNRAARPGAGGAATVAGALGQHNDVILYGTAWCSACRAARAYLAKKRVPFVNKDIEQDQAAAGELMQKAQAAGISPSGVPVIDVRGKLIQGFDAKQVDAALAAKQ